ncbi:Maf-like protein [Leptospira gomenensis]|uniref:dTTP/UTP pyrophosphatase n=1 Tax=Leptospira gomenensis TaxID=2484974 RepID=A0A5F1YS56_9LEPT|nr:nucleoside triphosphate pyrophosphatase [Leptospira gomenensis]TGK28020.1 Maf-like protein [Leptospira gomenensis]TGK37125.1 Maf-like protein [Leptospira gomenensis]TGK45761.1 Maf-like protein [Leptospira gomenensis]TGK59700.1 Maf-like protein [Leptospira gomenensis]
MIVLRSRSPRRKQVLETLDLDFRIEPEDVDERSLTKESPLEYLRRITLAKLGTRTHGEFLISCDTIVVQGTSILQKPENVAEALKMLRSLSGKAHLVYSGLGLYRDGLEQFAFDSSRVYFHSWEEPRILKYIEQYKPFDKAGSYGIQDKNGPVRHYEGSYTNILGFPIRMFYQYHGMWKEYLKGNQA